MSISRRLPNSNPTRQLALNNARDKHASLPGNDVLKTSTATALTSAATAYNAAMQNVANARALLNAKTPVKDEAVQQCRQFCSHFIQVFNLGVARSKYQAGHRAFYHLEVSSDAVPALNAEGDVKLWGHYVVDGDAARVTAGGLAMANPDATEVAAKLSTMETQLTEHSNMTDALDTATEAIEALNTNADILIKKVWDEVESVYNSETPESKRDNCREWGVVYVTDGAPAALSGLVKDSTGAAVPNASVLIKETGSETTTNTEGRYTLSTSVTGTITIMAGYPTGTKGQQVVSIPEHNTGIAIEVPDIVLS